jgi:hypothetical protein
MPDVTVTIPTGSVQRVRDAFIGRFGLDPAITNADLLTFLKARLANDIRDVVRTWEHQELVRQAQEASIDADTVAT